MKPIYILEHLEPKLYKWCLIEYENISKIIGKNNLWFTNIKRKSKKLEKLGKTFKQSVKDMNLKKVCVLDPETQLTLKPSDKKKFKYFVFGGILGDYPPKKRTKKELTKFMKNASVRNIGKRQFPTDQAFLVTKRILSGASFKDLKFKYKLTIPISKYSDVTLPFNYLVENNKPAINPRIISYLKYKKGF